jgi:anthraniloyl-CoA monooxygenase
MRVSIIGGGPAGLCAAGIIKQRQPTWDVELHERQPPEQTFGYGVGLGWSALKRLAAADAATAHEIESRSLTTSTWTIRRDGESISAANSHGVAVSRTELLRVLRRQAIAAGVDVRAGSHVTVADLDAAEVVIAADGVGSETRTKLTNELGASVSAGDLAYMWCGANMALDGMVLALARTKTGPLAAHVMPYAPGVSTFQVDAHTDVVRGWDLAPTAQATTALLEEQFADLLGGVHVETKRPDWVTFPTVRCERWSFGNVVLLGDAVHTAHYTVGSGTGLAVDDAVAIADALTGAGSIPDAFASYEASRMPHVVRLQRRAERSERWWSSLNRRIDLPLAQLMLSYLTRTGAVTLANVMETNPSLVDDCRAAVPGAHHTNGDTIGDAADTPTLTVSTADIALHINAARQLIANGSSLLRLVGPKGRDALMDRFDVAEEIRSQFAVATIVQGSDDTRDDLTLGILTNRTDFVELV